MHLQFKGGNGRKSQFYLTRKKPSDLKKTPSYLDTRKYITFKNMSQWIF